MKLQQYLRFPSALARARSNARLSQKAMAISAGVDQSYLSGVETGRRPVPQAEAVERFIAALRSARASLARDELIWAAAHDRVLRCLSLNDLAMAAPIVSSAMSAARRLNAVQLAGLVVYMDQLVESSGRLADVAALAATEVADKEIAM
jgi:transcriptional regulator with XRE-family HTH domain